MGGPGELIFTTARSSFPPTEFYEGEDAYGADWLPTDRFREYQKEVTTCLKFCNRLSYRTRPRIYRSGISYASTPRQNPAQKPIGKVYEPISVGNPITIGTYLLTLSKIRLQRGAQRLYTSYFMCVRGILD